MLEFSPLHRQSSKCNATIWSALLSSVICLTCNPAFAQSSREVQKPETRFHRWVPSNSSDASLGANPLMEQLLKRNANRSASKPDPLDVGIGRIAPSKEPAMPKLSESDIATMRGLLDKFNQSGSTESLMKNLDTIPPDLKQRLLSDTKLRDKAQSALNELSQNGPLNEEQKRSLSQLSSSLQSEKSNNEFQVQDRVSNPTSPADQNSKSSTSPGMRDSRDSAPTLPPSPKPKLNNENLGPDPTSKLPSVASASETKSSRGINNRSSRNPSQASERAKPNNSSKGEQGNAPRGNNQPPGNSSSSRMPNDALRAEEWLSEQARSDIERSIERAANNLPSKPNPSQRQSNSTISSSSIEKFQQQLHEKGWSKVINQILSESAGMKTSDKSKSSPSSRNTAQRSEKSPGDAGASKSGLKSDGRQSNSRANKGSEGTRANRSPESVAAKAARNLNNSNSGSNSDWLTNAFERISKSWTLPDAPKMSPRQSPSNAAASPKSGAPSFELPEMPTSSNWLLGLFALAIVGLVGFWAWLRFGDKLPINHPLRKKTANVLTLQPIGEVSTREDVVRAFHILSSRLVSAVQPWWTHRAVADWLWKSSPSVSEPMRDMAEIYEHARYLPADSNLTMDEVERAKRAIHQCEHATS